MGAVIAVELKVCPEPSFGCIVLTTIWTTELLDPCVKIILTGSMCLQFQK